MTVLLLAAAIIAGLGAIAALAPIDVRLGIVGLTAALVAAALLVDPLPGPAVLGIRLSATLLAVVLLRTAAAGLPARRGAGERGWAASPVGVSLPGWPAQLLLGLAGAAAGLAIAGGVTPSATIEADAGQPLAGLLGVGVIGAPGLQLAVAGLLVAVALGPVITGQIGLRRTIAAILLAEAAILVRSALMPAAGVLAEIAFGLLIVMVAIAGSLLAGHASDGLRQRAVAPGGPATDWPDSRAADPRSHRP